MISKTQIQDLLAVLTQNGADFADIFISETRNSVIICDDDKIEKIISGIDLGIGIRSITGSEISYIAGNEINFDDLRTRCETLGQISKPKTSTSIDLREAKHHLDLEIKRTPQSVPIDEKVKAVQLANKTARAFGNLIRQVSVGYADSVQNVIIANSEGEYVKDNRTRTRFTVNVIAEKNGFLQNGYEAPGGFCGFELLDKFKPEILAEKATKRAILMLDAPHAPSGKMTVILSSEAGGTMIHEACGHAFEADFIYKKTSVFTNKMGKKVASDLITVIDDATIPGKFGTYRFDDEGTPSHRNVLIENGIMKSIMSDRYNAKLLGIKSSGNGRRESFRNKPTPRMSNTFIAQGKTPPEEIISSVNNGLFVRKMGGGQVDVVNGDFVFEVTEGYIIENGKIKNPVRGAILTGNGPKILEIIDMVGTDLEFATGVCGKYDHAPVSDAQPTIRIPEIVVGGR